MGDVLKTVNYSIKQAYDEFKFVKKEELRLEEDACEKLLNNLKDKIKMFKLPINIDDNEEIHLKNNSV